MMLCSKIRLFYHILVVPAVLLARREGGGELHLGSICVVRTCLLFSVVIVLQDHLNILLPDISLSTKDLVPADWGEVCFYYMAALC